MSTKSVLEIILASMMLISLLLIFLRSFLAMRARSTKQMGADTVITTGKVGGIGARVIQFLCLALIIPALLILSLEQIIKGETVATIIGSLIGYVLSGIGDYKKETE